MYTKCTFVVPVSLVIYIDCVIFEVGVRQFLVISLHSSRGCLLPSELDMGICVLKSSYVTAERHG